MTQLILKNSIDSVKMEVLIHLLKSWDIDAEIKDINPDTGQTTDPFSEVRGIWADYEITDMELGEKAFGTQKRYSNDTL
jgi:hypothetical protein